MKKKCFKCEEVKSLDYYYKHAKMADGHLNKCKECTRKDVKEREDNLRKDPEWCEKERARHRDKYYRLDYKNKHRPTPKMRREAIERYKLKYPEKVRARNRSSHLKAEIKGNHLHHWSYAEGFEKDVIELSEKEHNLLHRFLTYDQKEMLYRADLFSDELLDTKFKHLEYFRFILLKTKTNK